MIAADLIRAGEPHPARPWPRYALSSQGWRSMAQALPQQPDLQFQALWADAGQVFALFTLPAPLLVSAPVEAGLYGALSPYRPDAALFERMVADLWGHLAADGLDARPWLDHGCWPVLRPMLPNPVPNAGPPEAPELREAEGEALHRILLGPVRPGIAEPARIGVAARGETVVCLEARLGYAHKGTLALMRGRTLDEAALLVARLSGEGAVAHALAFARAAEAALGLEPPPRALALREVLAGLERVAVHLHDIGAALDAAGHDPAQPERQREAVLQAGVAAFGHRLLMDVVAPGGLARELAADGAAAIGAALQALTPVAWPPAFAHRAHGCGGLSRLHAVRADIAHTIGGLRALLRGLPDGAVRSAVPPGSGEGLGTAQGARGACWHWLRLQDGRVAEAFARDPAWLLWPAMERAAVGVTLADLPLLAASFGLSASGMDL